MNKFDAKQFVKFMDKVEWEGSIYELVQHGYGGSSGFNRLDNLIQQLESIVTDYDSMVLRLYNEHSAEIDLAERELDDE